MYPTGWEYFNRHTEGDSVMDKINLSRNIEELYLIDTQLEICEIIAYR